MELSRAAKQALHTVRLKKVSEICCYDATPRTKGSHPPNCLLSACLLQEPQLLSLRAPVLVPATRTPPASPFLPLHPPQKLGLWEREPTKLNCKGDTGDSSQALFLPQTSSGWNYLKAKQSLLQNFCILAKEAREENDNLCLHSPNT